MDRPHSATWPRRDDALRGTLARMRTLCTTRREASVPPGHRRYCHRLGGPLLLALLLSALQGSGASAQEVTLPIVADTSIASFEGERTLNYGHAARLKLKGLENIILLTPDCALLVGKRVEHAVLHLRGCDAHLMVRKVGLSTVATRWNEGTSEGSGPGGPGDSCFQSPELGSTRLWAGAGSCFLDAVGGRGSTLWSQSIATHDQDQWYSIEVDGRLLEACACGLSYGLAVSDDNGQTMSVAKQVDPQTNFSNNYFFAREPRASAPTITATLAPGATLEQVLSAWKDSYRARPFVRIRATPKDVEVANTTATNFIDIAATADRSTLIIASALDNLVKGASGQAVQNLNLMYGLPETAGLLNRTL